MVSSKFAEQNSEVRTQPKVSINDLEIGRVEDKTHIKENYLISEFPVLNLKTNPHS